MRLASKYNSSRCVFLRAASVTSIVSSSSGCWSLVMLVQLVGQFANPPLVIHVNADPDRPELFDSLLVGLFRSRGGSAAFGLNVRSPSPLN